MTKWLLSLFLLCTAINAKNYRDIADETTLPLLNPSFADRETAKLRLSSGMNIYLISDPHVDQSAASLSVQAGSWDDPIKYPGMAHFCEHMLFMGSPKYPGDNAFMNFIWDHNGTPNAFTAADRTVYGFSLTNEAFLEALDRFAQFFIDPLMPASGVARELHAVDQEHAKNIENDSWRLYMISKETGNPNHPNAQFSTGNSDTLGGIPPEAVREWFETHYSANLMQLVIYSPLPLKELKEAVVEIFSPIPNRAIEPLHIHQRLTSPLQRGHITYVKPVRQLRRLYLQWELPKQLIYDESKTPELLAYALMRGQKSSLLQVLKKKGLADDLNVEVEKIGQHHIIFELQIDLTRQGLENISSITQTCFETLALYQQSGIPTYLFDEMKTMAEINYQYQNHGQAFSYVMDAARALLDEDLATFPEKTHIPTYYDPEALHLMLSSLEPKECALFVIADPNETQIAPERHERWMKAEYSIRKIPEDSIISWENAQPHTEILLPEPNPFIPAHLQIAPFVATHGTLDAPFKIVDNESGRIFYARDTEYQTPESVYLLHIQSPEIDGSAHSSALLDLYTKTLYDHLQPTLDAASSSGLSTSFAQDHFRFHIKLQGYSEKAPLLLQELLKGMKESKPTEKQFLNNRELLSHAYANAQKELPIFQAAEMVSALLVEDVATNEEKLQALQSISYEDFLIYQKNLFAKTYIEAFICGNLTLKDAESLWLDINHILGPFAYPPENHSHRRVLSLPEGQGPFLIDMRTTSLGNAVILAIEEGNFSFENRAAQQILSQCLKSSFFSALRTKQKTAYIAKSWDSEKEHKLHQFFAVQSSTHQPIDLIYRFGLFIDDFIQELPFELNQERFDTIRQSLITQLQIPCKNLSEKAARQNKIAFEYNADFDWINKRINGLAQLNYDQFTQFAEKHLSRVNKKRLAVLFKGYLPKEKQFIYELIAPNEVVHLGRYEKRDSIERSNPYSLTENKLIRKAE